MIFRTDTNLKKMEISSKSTNRVRSHSQWFNLAHQFFIPQAAGPCATLSPSFSPFFERNHSFGVKMVSGNVWKTFKSCPLAWNPTGNKQIYLNRRRSYRNRHICKLFHFALSLLNSEIAITPERVARLTWFFGSMPKIEIYDHLIF